MKYPLHLNDVILYLKLLILPFSTTLVVMGKCGFPLPSVYKYYVEGENDKKWEIFFRNKCRFEYNRDLNQLWFTPNFRGSQ